MITISLFAMGFMLFGVFAFGFAFGAFFISWRISLEDEEDSK